MAARQERGVALHRVKFSAHKRPARSLLATAAARACRSRAGRRRVEPRSRLASPQRYATVLPVALAKVKGSSGKSRDTKRASLSLAFDARLVKLAPVRPPAGGGSFAGWLFGAMR